MLAARLTEQEECSVCRTHSALVPAYLMRDDGSVIRIWPSGHIERINMRRGRHAVKTVNNQTMKSKSAKNCKNCKQYTP